MRLIQVNFKLRPKKNNNNNNQQKKKNKKKQSKTKKKLIGNLKVTNSLNVDFTKFARAVFWLPSFYF